ncbi:MAG: DUF3131 domain-containing protein [Coleofasciculus sp. C2-GNP5-27]
MHFLDTSNSDNFYKVLKSFYEEAINEWLESGNKREDFTEKGAKIVIILDNASFHKKEEYINKIEAENALYNPPIQTIQVEGISLQIDQRNFANSNASNYLTSDPYLLWGLELGLPDSAKQQVHNLLQVQAQRFERTDILTAVNEDSLDRDPHFLYYSVYANGEPWNIVDSQGQSYPHLRFLSTKAAFAWNALRPDHPYTQTLRATVENLAERDRGFLAGRYENFQLGDNAVFNVNTNAIILESLLYKARGERPLAF